MSDQTETPLQASPPGVLQAHVKEFFQAICELIRLSSLTEATYEKRAAVLGRVVKAKQALDKACDDADDVLGEAHRALTSVARRNSLASSGSPEGHEANQTLSELLKEAQLFAEALTPGLPNDA